MMAQRVSIPDPIGLEPNMEPASSEAEIGIDSSKNWEFMIISDLSFKTEY